MFKRSSLFKLSVLLALCGGFGAALASASQAPTVGRIEANSVTLAFESFGRANDEAVLLIAGTGMQLTGWPNELVNGLVERGYRVIRFDNRDVGLSTTMDETGWPDIAAIGEALKAGRPAPIPYSLKDMAADALGLLDALNVRQAHLVGISMGGAIAELVAFDQPDRVLSLTLLGTDSGNPALSGLADPDAFKGVPPQPLTRDREAFVAWQVGVWQALAGSGYQTAEPALRRWAERDFGRGFDPAGLSRQQTVSFVGHLESARYRFRHLETIKVPTAVVQGTEDPLIPVASARDIAKRVPGAEMYLIPGLGHDVPVAFVPTLVNIITTVATSP